MKEGKVRQTTSRIRPAPYDSVFEGVVGIMVFIVILVTLYPIIYILANSISSGDAVTRREVWLYPIGFNLTNYAKVFTHKYILLAYRNTLVYTILGVAWSMILTILGAYPLSRKNLPGRDGIMLFIAFTMLFSAGLIPYYLVIKEMGMLNKIWAIIIPAAISQYNLIILRTNFMSIPDSLEESAKIDGASDFKVMMSIILPMSVPGLCTIGLMYLIGRWNDFFTAMIFLNDKNLYPLQLILRDLLITMSDTIVSDAMLSSSAAGRNLTPMGFKSAVIIISMLPLMIIYPFLQRYFVKGAMIGAIKG